MKLKKSVLMVLCALSPITYAETEDALEEIRVTAENQLKQSLGVSTVQQRDIKAQGVVNDISEIVRKQPGVNLTGNSPSGQRGNNRQIDIRGMGPENTLILIDGRPVRSRASVRYSKRGERDTRGDSNWVPAEMIDRIEVFRGPAAAHYGDGAAGGVVNIITKKQFDKFSGSLDTLYNRSYHDEEGDSRRINLSVMGPLTEHWSYRIYGSYNKTDPDKWYINIIPIVQQAGQLPAGFTAGREGVKNRDFNGLLRYAPSEAHVFELEYGYSRQNNIYAGDSQLSNSSHSELGSSSENGGNVSDLIGRSTNIMQRENVALTYEGKWGNISNKTYLQHEWTSNQRLDEGISGAGEGAITQERRWIESKLRNFDLKTETFVELNTTMPQTLTLGLGYNEAHLNDPNIGRSSSYGIISKNTGTDSRYSTKRFSATLEDNIAITSDLVVVPGIFFEYHNVVGGSINPTLNLWYNLTDNLTLKTGIARAYKSPNIHQLAPNYRLYSRGGGYGNYRPCYVQGNEDLNAESSINSEIGLEYNNDKVNVSLTYFNNDYKNKVDVNHKVFGKVTSGTSTSYVFQYYNVPKALVRGLEGSVNWKVLERLSWNNNFTYMMKSLNKTTGEALSTIPKYTINSTLDWQITDKLRSHLAVTLYGRQHTKVLRGDGTDFVGGEDRAAYALWSWGAQYDMTKNIHLRTGVKNIFDKRLFRYSGNTSGANSYNEPGRSIYMGVGITF
ncbi:FepA family TonB-dependent siderophore receptor [Pasteurella bettyae]|uniref:FepA family TonB-dependent siderophore receptor n=1 Tax=Pasteurella bettyae TaxID=752 RepID=UPI003D2C5743